MELTQILQGELKGSLDFFNKYTNLDPNSHGYGLVVDSTKKPAVASIASVGFSLSAWVIAAERGYLTRQNALGITKRTLHTLLEHASHSHGFFAHYLHMDDGSRFRKCEFSTIDTSICLNGVITASAYFQDEEVEEMAQQLLERADWSWLVFEMDGRTLFRMAYNPDKGGDYVEGEPGFIHRWWVAAEQKMMYLQAAPQLNPATARALYQGFTRHTGDYNGQTIIINPGGTLFCYLFSEAWLDFSRYLDPDGVDWFNNTRLAALADRSFCIAHASEFKTYHASSWGLSAGDGPRGYSVCGSTPCLFHEPYHDGTVSIYSAIGCLPFIPVQVLEMVDFLYREQPQTWGKYGFYDAYNLDVSPAWYSHAIYGIDKGCSLIMIENYLTQLIWDLYTNSAYIQKALAILGFRKR